MNPAFPEPPLRYFDLLEQLRNEYDSVLSENKGLRGIRDEYNRKVEQQINELTNMERSLLELERKHQLVREQYDQEIARLKHQGDNPKQEAQLPMRQAGKLNPLPAARALDTPKPPSYGPPLQSFTAPPAQRNPPQQDVKRIPPPPHHHQSQPHHQPHHPIQQQQQQQIKFPRIVGAEPAGLSGSAPLPGTAPLPSLGAGGAMAVMSNGPNPPPPPPPRIPPPGKMHSVGMINGATDEVHPFKKDGAPLPQQQGARPPMMGTVNPANLANQNSRYRVRGPSHPPNVVSHEDDYQVTPGRSTNGALVNMKVSLQTSVEHDSVVCCVKYSWDGMFLATGANRSAHILNAHTGQCIATFSKDTSPEREANQTQDSYVRAVCFSPEGNWLITGAEDHVVKVWDVRNRTVKHRLVGHSTDIYSVDASANGQFIISGSGDKKAKLWNLDTGSLLTTLGGDEYGPTDGITSVSVSPTSQHVAAGSLDKVVRVWDVESGRLVRSFEGHRDSVYSVAFAPDGRMLLSGSLDRTLKLWDLAASQPNSQCRLSFSGHRDFVLSVGFSPDGRWLISGSKDRTVQFWDPRQSTACLSLQGHKNSVISIAHNPANKSIGTGSGDCRARIWRYG